MMDNIKTEFEKLASPVVKFESAKWAHGGLEVYYSVAGKLFVVRCLGSSDEKVAAMECAQGASENAWHVLGKSAV